ncbi:Rare lipoprotein A precursor [Serratia plymuthica]|uniref:Rare lipoprotein A n=1 Tax=Serratia plymuthica TaxID=82996 RepID=A0A2X4X2D8_SERPL|nr:Rare lipoprotein A precursor [Serratia plymuthica]
MRKEWLWVGVVAVLLSACTSPTTEQQAPPQQPYNGPVVEIGGVEPQYEPYNPGTLQDYKVNGDTYRIVKDPQNFSQTGLASSYGEEARATPPRWASSSILTASPPRTLRCRSQATCA